MEDDWPPADRAYFLYVHTDHLGGSQLMTEGSERSTHNGLRFIKGEVVQRIEYSPFGKERFVLNPELEEGPQFTGQKQDIEDGLYYYNARYYDPVLGRFIQPDPVVFSDPRNPQTLNGYTYALNNPLKYIDPSGNSIEGPDGELYRDTDAALRAAEAKEAREAGGRLEGSGTTGNFTLGGDFEFKIPGSREFYFEGLDRGEFAGPDFADRFSLGEDFDFGSDRVDIDSWIGFSQSFVETVLEVGGGLVTNSVARALLGATGKSAALLGIVTFVGGPGEFTGGWIGAGIGVAVGLALAPGIVGGALAITLAVGGGYLGSYVGRKLDRPTAGELF